MRDESVLGYVRAFVAEDVENMLPSIGAYRFLPDEGMKHNWVPFRRRHPGLQFEQVRAIFRRDSAACTSNCQTVLTVQVFLTSLDSVPWISGSNNGESRPHYNDL